MTLKRTPLFDKHVAAGAKMVDFGGFEMPLKYTSETEEHHKVRTSCGLFDVSHMGEVVIEGEAALAACQRLFTNDVARIVDGQALYAGMLNERGTFIDDVVIYRRSSVSFFVVVNAGNREKDWAWIDAVVRRDFGGDATARDEGERWAQLAVQGPRAVDIVVALCGERARAVGGYHFYEGTLLQTRGGVDVKGLIARTGYTGEDGFELYVPSEHAQDLWDAVVQAGKPHDLALCGLACRDTLRLEAGMCLYGNDIDEDHTPLEANLGWIVKTDNRPSFIGQQALLAQKERGIPRVLRGLEMTERGIARHGYRVVDIDGRDIGVVTSGTQAPHVNKAIAFAYLAPQAAEPGTSVAVEVRGKPVRALVVKLPFYKRPR